MTTRVRRFLPEAILLVAVLVTLHCWGWFWGTYSMGTFLLVALWRHLLVDDPSTPLKLQSSQSFTVEVPEAKLTPEALYNAAVALTTHSDAMSWSRLYTLLTANSIMMLAWATIYVSPLPEYLRGQVGFFVALPGLILSAAWAPFGSRNRRLHRRWGDFYVKLERLSVPPTGPGVAAEALSYLRIEEWCKTGHLVVAVPIAFADVFWFVMLRSLFQWRAW